MKLRYPILILAVYAMLIGLVGYFLPFNCYGATITIQPRADMVTTGPVTQPATRPVLGVGPSEPYRTIADALAHARDGDTVQLDAGAYDLGGVSLSTGRSITITCATRATIRYVSPAGSKYVQQALMLSGSNVTVENIDFDVTNSAVGAWCITAYRARGVTIKNCTFGGRAMKFDAVQQTSTIGLTVDGCTFDTTEHYSAYAGSADGGKTSSADLKILNSTFRGAGEHCVRTHGLDGLLIDGCTVDNTWDRYNAYHGGALNLRDGRNFVVKNTTVYGSFGLGPLPQSPATVWLDGVTVTNCREFGGYFAIEPNTKGVKIDGLELHSDQSGNALNIKGAVNGKADPAGAVTNVRWEYAGGRGTFCNHLVPSIAWTNIAPFAAAPAPAPPTVADLTAQIKAQVPAAVWPLIDQLAARAK
jgi:hypothetical protein